jgi:hypothetical protein
MSCVLSTLGLLALAINSLIVVRYGRRRVLLMSGLVTCGILQLIIAITYHKNPGTKKTGKVLVALSCLYMMSYNVSLKHGYCLDLMKLTHPSGNGLTIRMVDRRRNPITTSSKLHFRSLGCNRILLRMAYSIYRSLFYQSTFIELGSTIRIHLVSICYHHRRLGVLFLT